MLRKNVFKLRTLSVSVTVLFVSAQFPWKKEEALLSEQPTYIKRNAHFNTVPPSSSEDIASTAFSSRETSMHSTLFSSHETSNYC